MERRIGWITTLAIFCSLLAIGLCEEDVKCYERQVEIEGRSKLCICNAEHCDTITRINPQRDHYVMYTSSKAGQRFEVTRGRIRSTNDPDLPPDTTNGPPVATLPTFPPPSIDLYNEQSEDNEPVLDTVQSYNELDADTEIDVADAYDVPSYLDDDKMDDYSVPSDLDAYISPDPEVPSDLETSILSSLVKKHVLEEKPDPYDEPRPPISLPPLPDLPFPRTHTTLTVFTVRRFQTIEGFGGSVTDAASINWNMLSERTRQRFIDTYFGPKGLEYNMIRVPIGGSDFSTHPYTLNDLPWNDHSLSNFSLAEEDLLHKLPMIKAIKEVAPTEVKVTASTWSPPVWMKTNERILGFGQLKSDSYQTYADYHLRFLEEYEKHDVKVWAITTTNEPLNGIVPVARFNSLGFSPWQMAKYIVEHIGPTIRNSRFNKTLILGIDDQRYMLPIYLRGMRKEDPKFLDYLDGIAVHYYGNFVTPRILNVIHNQYSDKILLATEACEGAMPWERAVELGSWRRARRYVTNIMEDLNHHVVGWIDWNLCLNLTGGPNWARNYVDAPILVDATRDEFIKQPMYYAMGHFSKFIPRGSQVVSMTRRGARVEHIAVIKPDNNIVVVIQNRRTRALDVTLFVSEGERFIEFEMEPESIKTIEFHALN